MKIAVYPGTFDPITNGHIDIVYRALKLFDKIILAVGIHTGKEALFTVEERYEFLQKVASGIPAVEVKVFDGLLVEFAKEHKACAVVRGLRAVSDFEYEFQMSLMNKKLFPDLETVFLMTSSEYNFLSSSIIKQVAVLGGCVSNLVPDVVDLALKKKF